MGLRRTVETGIHVQPVLNSSSTLLLAQKCPKGHHREKLPAARLGRPSGNLQLTVSDGSDMKIVCLRQRNERKYYCHSFAYAHFAFSYPRDYPRSPELFQGGPERSLSGLRTFVRVCSAAVGVPVSIQTRQGLTHQTTANGPSSLFSLRIGRSGVEGWCKKKGKDNHVYWH
jgi:hypothetical protein